MRCRSLLLGVMLLSGCWFECADARTQVLVSGAYQTEPEDASDHKLMQLDRAGGTVIVRYTRAGKAVVERWRIKKIASDAP